LKKYLYLTIIITGLVLALLLKEIVYAVIVIPIARLVYNARYLGGIILGSMDQLVFWISFILSAAIIGLVRILNLRDSSEKISDVVDQDIGNIQSWRDRLQSLTKGDYFKWRFSQFMSSMTLDILAYNQGMSNEQIKDHLAKNTLEVPPEIRAYLQAAYNKNIDEYFSTYRDIDRNHSPLYLNPEKIIIFLEDNIKP